MFHPCARITDILQWCEGPWTTASAPHCEMTDYRRSLNNTQVMPFNFRGSHPASATACTHACPLSIRIKSSSRATDVLSRASKICCAAPALPTKAVTDISEGERAFVLDSVADTHVGPKAVCAATSVVHMWDVHLTFGYGEAAGSRLKRIIQLQWNAHSLPSTWPRLPPVTRLNPECELQIKRPWLMWSGYALQHNNSHMLIAWHVLFLINAVHSTTNYRTMCNILFWTFNLLHWADAPIAPGCRCAGSGLHLIDRQEAQTQCGLLRSASFRADRRRRRLTSTQPSHSSRPDSPLSLWRFADGMRSVSAMWAFQCAVTERRCSGAGCLRSAGPPVFFFFTSAVTVISGSVLFVTSQSLRRLFLLPCSVSIATSCLKCGKSEACALLKNHRACERRDHAEWAETVGGGVLHSGTVENVGLSLNHYLATSASHTVTEWTDP